MRIEQINTEARFQALRQEWNSVLHESASNTIFLTWEWLTSWWAAYGQGKRLLILVARDTNGVCLGIAPLYLEGNGSGSRVRFLGDGSYDSDYLDFIVIKGCESHVVPALLEELTKLRRNWSVLQLSEIPQQSPNLELLLALKERNGWYLSQQSVPCGIRTLPASWEEFLQTLKPRFRTTVRACLRNLEQWGGSFEVLEQADQIPEWLHDLFVLHSGRWASRHQSGVFKTGNKQKFYRQMAQSLLERGWLHMTRFRLNGVVLACQFGFVYRGVYNLLQEGFDIQCTHVSPGVTLRAATIRNLIASGTHTYDFLGGIGRHKTDWGAQEKTSLRLTLAPKGVSGYARIELSVAIQKAKDQIKAVLPKHIKEWRKAGNAPGNDTANDGTSEAASANGQVRGWKQSLASTAYHSGLLRTVGRASLRYELGRRNSSRFPTLRKTTGPKFAILCYHRVGIGGVPLYSELEPEVFEAQMHFLRANYRLVSLDTLHDELSQPGNTDPAVAVTFDDGYRDVYTHAYPVLQKYQVPATIFLTATAIEKNEVSWYDRIFVALSAAFQDKLDLVLDKPRRFLLSSPAARMRAAEEIISWLRTVADEKRRKFCSQLETDVPAPAELIADRMLTWDQIREMHKGGVGFGAHTLSHPSVSRLTPLALEEELRVAKAMVEERLGAAVQHFAYPFGKPSDYKGTENVVARHGYRSACTTVWGVNTPGVNPYELSRVSLGEERHLPTFGLKFAQLFLSANSHEDQPASVSLISGDPARSSS